MHVSAVLKRKGGVVVTATPEQTIASVAMLLTANRIGAVLVVTQDGGLAGILSERDIIRGIAEHGAAVLSLPAERLMTREVTSCRPSDTIGDVMKMMTRGRFRHVPVLDHGRIQGVISIGDAVKQRLDEAELEVETLRGYVSG